MTLDLTTMPIGTTLKCRDGIQATLLTPVVNGYYERWSVIRILTSAIPLQVHVNGRRNSCTESPHDIVDIWREKKTVKVRQIIYTDQARKAVWAYSLTSPENINRFAKDLIGAHHTILSDVTSDFTYEDK